MVRLARQRRPGWLAAGVALLALAVLGNVYLFRTSGHRLAVLRVARNVPIGRQISRADLGIAQVALDVGVASIPGRQLGDVVGHRAAVDLRQGTLLTASQVTSRLTPSAGQALVAAGFKPGQLPPEGLAPGSRVRIVFTGDDQTASDSGAGQSGPGTASSEAGAATAVKDVPAVVDQVGGPDADGTVPVALLVTDADASAVARAATAGHLALVVTTRGG